MSRQDIGDVAAIMLDYVEQDKTFQTDKIVTVPARSYVDPDQWAAEMELVFCRVPLMLAMTAELPKPGDYKAMDAMGRPLLITRDKDGKVHVFLNVCAHRGAPVAAEGHGNCSRFSCKYHGWTYSNDGRLLAVADGRKFGEIDRSQRGLRELPSVERAGMIFASLTPGQALDIDAFYGDFIKDFDDLDLAHWTFLGQRVIEGANWKIAFDGYLEGYHFAALHPQTIHPRTPSNCTYYEAFGPHLRIGFPQVTIKEKLAAKARSEWAKSENDGFDFVRIFFPNVSAFVAPEITQFAQLFPGPTPDKNRTVLNFLRREPIRDEDDRKAVEGMMDWLRAVVNDEDYKVGDEIQKGLKSGALDSIVFGKNERGNQYFHEYLNWYLQDDASLPRPKL